MLPGPADKGLSPGRQRVGAVRSAPGRSRRSSPRVRRPPRSERSHRPPSPGPVGEAGGTKRPTESAARDRASVAVRSDPRRLSVAGTRRYHEAGPISPLAFVGGYVGSVIGEGVGLFT